MSVETLKRDPVMGKCDVDEFVKKARRVGYKAFDQDVARRKFREILGSINMAPLTRVEVERYKAKLQSDADWKAFRNRFGLLATMLAEIVTIIGGAVVLYRAGLISWGVMSFGSALLAVVSLIVTVGVWRFEPWYVWRLVDLKEYDQAVPRYALQTAIDVDEAVARYNVRNPESKVEVKFYVDHFRRRESERSCDPFLVTSVHADRMWAGYEYLEVWDEPDFDLDREI